MITPVSNTLRMPPATPLAGAQLPVGALRRLAAMIFSGDTMELVFSLAALWLTATLMLQLAPLANGGDGRFRVTRLQSVRLHAPLLDTACAELAQWAAPQSTAACGKVKQDEHAAPPAAWPALLQQAISDDISAFVEPVRAQLNQLESLEQRQREGNAPEGAEALDEKIAALRADLAPYLRAYDLQAAPYGGPAVLKCVAGIARNAWGSADAPGTRAGVALWLAAALDGKAQAMLLDDPTFMAIEGAWARAPGSDCAGYATAADAAAGLAGIIDTARQHAAAGVKAEMALALLGAAWWQWGLWTITGLLLVKVYRRAVPADCWRHTGLVLVAWAAVAWASRVWLPFADAANLQWTQFDPDLAVMLPPWPLLAMAACGLLLWIAGGLVRAFTKPRAHEPAHVRVPQQPSSWLAYPGLILFMGIGWLLLLDLSATGHPRNRFLGLYQQGYLWGALGLMVLATLWRQRIAYLLVRWFGLFEHLARAVARCAGGAWWGTVLLLCAVAVVFLLASGNPQVTSEMGRLWLILGVAWYFYVEGDLASRLASQGRMQSFARFLYPLVVVVAALGLAMLVTNDMGPLLVSAYGAGIFLAAAVTYILQLRNWFRPMCHLAGLTVLCAWFAGLTEALFTFGRLGSTTAVRLESAAMPLVARNDQIGVITWFRKATPEWGYGVGSTPWCGYSAAGHCRGVPLQIHSDYTFTALWGLFGPLLAAAFAVAAVLWLYVVIRRHGRASSGTLTATRRNGAWGIQTQAFLSWVCVTWLILTACQIVVTVAGNLRVLPLTGITFPFVSYGKTSLWVNAVLLGLSMTIDVPARIRHKPKS